jgi:5-(aminomethyl)-3-furanmethanol phosphate kinase
VSVTGERPLTVVKVGGGLTANPGALQRVCATLAEAAREQPIVVVPGGGPFADAVRKFDRSIAISAETAHWMAILAMDQYAHALAGLIPGAVLVDEVGSIGEIQGMGRTVVLAPSRWMRSADVLPHSWDVTSDSIAAFIAGALGATRLLLIKPVSDAAEPTDPHFISTLPADLPYYIVGAERLDQLASRLTD